MAKSNVEELAWKGTAVQEIEEGDAKRGPRRFGDIIR